PACVINTNGGTFLFFARDEALDPVVRHVVRPLLGRRLHQPGGRRAEGALEAPGERALAGANGVDDDPGGVGRVPHLELELDVNRLIAEAAPFEADVRPLAI